ncbi:hypothetical protein AbraCBS73388_008743 [Aspergillus brasiliensis]|uniref:Anhydro-N-acetylmuramic acid kinase n=1 Tax=Aspergillus brasiliensis TaxID=319629 RepID=A0A9W6DUK4_9EURO|nr:hypothetical protein AbraCBS73388_008743 [Aspergillus brasiliensis]
MKAFENELSLFDMTRANYAAGPEDIDVVGYDGQTVYQEPPERHLTTEYNRTGSQSLVDRSDPDHALGGSGAPLMQYLDFVAFRNESPIVTLNIGGIANLQVANADRSRMMAFDTGPGNVMLDHVVKARIHLAYDKDGELTAKGTVIEPLLEELEKQPFFRPQTSPFCMATGLWLEICRRLPQEIFFVCNRRPLGYSYHVYGYFDRTSSG